MVLISEQVQGTVQAIPNINYDALQIY